MAREGVSETVVKKGVIEMTGQRCVIVTKITPGNKNNELCKEEAMQGRNVCEHHAKRISEEPDWLDPAVSRKWWDEILNRSGLNPA